MMISRHQCSFYISFNCAIADFKMMAIEVFQIFSFVDWCLRGPLWYWHWHWSVSQIFSSWLWWWWYNEMMMTMMTIQWIDDVISGLRRRPTPLKYISTQGNMLLHQFRGSSLLKSGSQIDLVGTWKLCLGTWLMSWLYRVPKLSDLELPRKCKRGGFLTKLLC